MSFIIQEIPTPTVFGIGVVEPTGAGGAISFEVGTQDELFFEGDASANFTVDVIYDSTTSLNVAMQDEDVVTIHLKVKNGLTPYALENFSIDGQYGSGIEIFFGGNEFLPLQGATSQVYDYAFEITKVSNENWRVFIGINSDYSEPYNPPAPAFGVSATDLGIGSAAEITFTAGDLYGAGSATFTVISNPSAITATGSASPITVNGLTALGTYDFTVKTQTFAGQSTSNPSNQITLVQPVPLTVNFLVVAGGGGGGSSSGFGASGGGGGGGYRNSTGTSGGGGAAESAVSALTGSLYTLTVGAGGATSTSGSNSVFSTITSTGGGRGGPLQTNGSTGGSGGGAGTGNGAAAPGSGTANQGYAGGNAVGSNNDGTLQNAGGGGGAAAVGGNADATNAGNGGAGVASTITGNSVTRAGGGGGGKREGGGSAGSGGTGGGGAGGKQVNGTAGTVNTGGGGGGTGSPGSSLVGGQGGSGIVVLKYSDTFTISNPGGGLTYSETTAAGVTTAIFTAGTGNVRWTN